MTANPAGQLPAYEPQLEAYHKAFERDLENIIFNLPIRTGDKDLDMACGSGFYSLLLARRVGSSGNVIAVDNDASYLKLARDRIDKTTFAAWVDYKKGNIERLPFRDKTFDAVWCAQSLYSLPEPVKVLKELRRVVRPRGIVAILENDLLHQVLLPWPPGFEMRIRQAEYAALKAQKKMAGKFYLPRRLSTIFVEAGLLPDRKKTHAHTRHAPLGADARRFLKFYLDRLKTDAFPFLSQEDQTFGRQLLNASSSNYILNDLFFSMTCLDTVLWGIRP
jgi:SAM-dependent methyltransferase